MSVPYEAVVNSRCVSEKMNLVYTDHDVYFKNLNTLYAHEDTLGELLRANVYGLHVDCSHN